MRSRHLHQRSSAYTVCFHMFDPLPGPLSLPSSDLNDSHQFLYPESTTLFPHVSNETIQSIARFEFPQDHLEILLRVKHESTTRRVSRANDVTPSKHLIQGISNVLEFAEAWVVFTAILQNERPDLPIAQALNGYLCTIFSLSRGSEWQNVLNYHLAFLATRAHDSFFNPLLWISADHNLVVMHCPPRGLLRLNDDCLRHIIEWAHGTGGYIDPSEGSKATRNLSLCCSRLRAICLPTIFANMTWPLSESDGNVATQARMIPDQLLGHIR